MIKFNGIFLHKSYVIITYTPEFLSSLTWKRYSLHVTIKLKLKQLELEQLECLRSEDTPRRPMITHTTESCWIKRRQSQSYKFQEFAKISIFLILTETLHVTHLLKLLDKMCKYEMDPTSILEDTEWTWFFPQKDRRTRWNQYTPLSTSLKRGYIKNALKTETWRSEGTH